MKRKLKWPAIVLAVLVLGFGTPLWLWPRDRITPASWKEIRIGMTVAEVESILGRPGMAYDDFEDHLDALAKNDKFPVPDHIRFAEPEEGEWKWIDEGKNKVPNNTKYWIGQRGRMVIQLSPSGQVIGKYFHGWRSPDPSFPERLRDWLGW